MTTITKYLVICEKNGRIGFASFNHEKEIVAQFDTEKEAKDYLAKWYQSRKDMIANDKSMDFVISGDEHGFVATNYLPCYSKDENGMPVHNESGSLKTEYHKLEYAWYVEKRSMDIPE
ncbi:MAG: hypothetical protein IJS02_04465 [Bacteroidales bacterium]|nr:hypothetical protein [Bacteroidales bacterium]